MSLEKFNRNRWPRDFGLTDFMQRTSAFDDDYFNLNKSLPAMNIKEHKEDFEIELAAPGFNKKDFEITMDNDVLQVSAKKTQEKIEEEEDYTRKEFNYNAFSRIMQLPSSVDADKNVKATYKDGILKMNLFKKEGAEEKPKRLIEVG